MPGTVLVVDDSPDVLDAFRMLLEMEGYAPICAENGNKALAYLHAAPTLPDAIFLDLIMPVMDGHTFRAAQLREPRFRAIPTVIMTAYPISGDIGGAPVLNKPLDTPRVLAALERATTPAARGPRRRQPAA